MFSKYFTPIPIRNFLLLICLLIGTTAYSQPCPQDDPSIDFTADIKQGCLPVLVHFYAKGAPAGSSVYWDFGKGKIIGGDTILQSFTQAGNYDVTYNVTYPDGSCHSVTKKAFLSFSAPGNPRFWSSGTVICNFPPSVTLVDSTTNVAKREWYINGDKLADTSAKISYVFPNAGYQNLALKVIDPKGCSKFLSKNNYILVPGQIKPTFSAVMQESSNHKSITAKFYTTFDTTGKNIVKYNWSFPGGSINSYNGFTPPPVIFSSLASAQDITLTITTRTDCILSYTKKSLIQKYYDDSAGLNVCYRTASYYHNLGLGYNRDSTPIFTSNLGSLNIGGKGYFFSMTYANQGVSNLTVVYRYTDSTSTPDTLHIPSYCTITPPNAEFKVLGTKGCRSNDTVTMTSTYSTPFIGTNTYTWRIFDAAGNELSGSPLGPYTSPTNKYVFNKIGAYTIWLTVSNSDGCTDVTRQNNVVKLLPLKASIAFPKSTYCIGEQLLPKNNSTPADDPIDAYSHIWKLYNVDDTAIKPIYYYQRTPYISLSRPGRYLVKYYIIADQRGCIDSVTYPTLLTINGVIVEGGFDPNYNPGNCVPLTEKLISYISKHVPNTTADSITYTWSTTPSTGVTIYNPKSDKTDIQFTKNGCYYYQITAKTKSGCSNYTGNKYCFGTLATFELPKGGCVGSPVSVTNTSTLSPDVFKWTVTPSTGVKIMPSDTSKQPKFMFSNVGCYKVTLKTTKKFDPLCIDTISHNICVAKPTPLFAAIDTVLRCAPQSAKFKNKSKGGVHYIWDFGDGSGPYQNDTDIVIEHLYQKNRSSGFTVKLTAINDAGCAETFTIPKLVHVYGPEPSFSVDTKKGCVQFDANFTNTSIDVIKYYMAYGDATPLDSNGLDKHTYYYKNSKEDSSVYYPTLYGLNDSGCFQFYTDTFIVYRQPVPDFSISNTAICTPDAMTIKNKSLYSDSYEWDFGDGGKDTATNPIHYYKKEGIYTITLTAKNRHGCFVVKKFDSIKVYLKPKVSFKVAKNIICFQDTASLTASFTSTAAPKSWLWDFGDSTNTLDSSSQMNPKYHYKYPGLHNIKLIMQNMNGCFDTLVATKAIKTLDTIPPAAPKILYVTVDNNREVKVVYKSSLNADFNNFKVFKSTNSETLIYQTSNRKDTSYTDIYPSANPYVSSESYSVTEQNNCGYTSSYSANHSTINLHVSAGPLNSAILLWTPYKGWTGIKSYSLYRQLNSDGNYKMLKILSGIDTTYTDSALCNNLYTYYVVATHVSGAYISKSNTDSLHPNYIMQSIPLPMKRVNVKNNNSLYVEWEKSVQPNVSYYMVDRKEDVNNWRIGYAKTINTSFIDKSVNVESSNYIYRVRVMDACGNISEPGRIGKSILLKGYVKDDKRNMNWTQYKDWVGGVYQYLVQIRGNDGIFRTISNVSAIDTVATDDSAHEDLSNGTCYRILAIENDKMPNVDTSISNELCLNLPSHVYIPTAFTPNNDSLNDVFIPVVSGIFKHSTKAEFQYQFQIYNRWGQLVFETSDAQKGWDGKFKGSLAIEGLYTYHFRAHGFDGIQYYNRGTFLLSR